MRQSKERAGAGGLAGLISIVTFVWDRSDKILPVSLFICLAAAFTLCTLYALSGWTWRRGAEVFQHIGRSLATLLVTAGLTAIFVWYFYPDPPFQATIEGILQKQGIGTIFGPYADLAGDKHPTTLTSIEFMPVIRIANEQKLGSNIKSYELDALDATGKWYRFPKIPVSKYTDLYFVHPDGYVTTMSLDISLDQELADKTIVSGGSVNGWTFFAYPTGFAGFPEKFTATMTITDWNGNAAKVNVTQAPRGVISGHNTIKFGDQKLAVSDYRFVRFTKESN